MQTHRLIEQEEDWNVLLSYLPAGWQRKARELGAFQRSSRKFSPVALLRLLLIHLADGRSLRETVAIAKLSEIIDVSDVALLKRLKASAEWFRWMSSELMKTWIVKQPADIYGTRYRLRIIDGSTVQEPGATGSNWRIHYSINLSTLQCEEVYVTEPEIGETFKQFIVSPDDLFIGDRGFGNRNSIRHVVDNKGAVLVRINASNLPMDDPSGNKFELLPHLRTIKRMEVGDWDVVISYKDGKQIRGRICAVKKSKEAAELARIKAIRESEKKHHKTKPETIESAEYTFVFTNLERNEFSASKVLEIYRGRWQIELAFKRLKSIIGLGHLKKTDVESAKAWIHGKLFVAFLIESLITSGMTFSPWGYKIPEATMPMEGNIPDASPSSTSCCAMA